MTKIVKRMTNKIVTSSFATYQRGRRKKNMLEKEGDKKKVKG